MQFNASNNRLIKSVSISFQARFCPRIMWSDSERVKTHVLSVLECCLHFLLDAFLLWQMPHYGHWFFAFITKQLLRCWGLMQSLRVLVNRLGTPLEEQCYAKLFSINRPGCPVHCEGHRNVPITQGNRQDTHYIPSKGTFTRGHPNKSWSNKRNLGVAAS